MSSNNMSSKRMSSLLMTSVVLGTGALATSCPEGYAAPASRRSYPGYGSVNGVGGANTFVGTQIDCANLCSADNECGSFEYDEKSKMCQLNLARFAISGKKEGNSKFCSKQQRLLTLDPPVFNADGSLSGLRWFSSVWGPAPDHPHYEQWQLDNMHGSLHTPYGWWNSALEEHAEGPHWMAIDVRMNDTDGNPQPRLVCGAIQGGRNHGYNDPNPHHWPTRASFRYSMDGERWFGIGTYKGNTIDDYKTGIEIEFRRCVEANYIKWIIREMNDPTGRYGGRVGLRIVELDVEKDTPLSVESSAESCEANSTYTITSSDECKQAITLLNAKSVTSSFYNEASEFEISSAELPNGCVVTQPSLTDYANYPFAKTVKFNTRGDSSIKCNSHSDVNCLCAKKTAVPVTNTYEAQATLPDGSVNNKGFCRHQSKLMVTKNGVTNMLQCQQECLNDPLCGYVAFNSNPSSELEPKCMLYHTEYCDMSQPGTGLVVLKQVGPHFQRVSERFRPHETMKTWKNSNQDLGFAHRGCYPSVDVPQERSGKHRPLRYGAHGFGGLRYKHRAMCSKLCEGYQYFGLKFRTNAEHVLGGRTRCYCGMNIQKNEEGNDPNPEDASNCSKPCEGDAGHTCGSDTHMDIYEHSDSRRRLGEANLVSKGLSLPEEKNMNSDVEEEEIDEEDESDIEDEDRRGAASKAIKKSLRGSK